MTQRTLAGLLAVPLLIGLWVAAAFEPLPYVTYEPGLTINVLGSNDGKEIIQVRGHKAYRDDGELRMTTVYVSQPRPRGDNNLFQLMHDWISRDDAVYPYDAVYPDNESVEQNRRQGSIEMTSSQDAATAAALSALGYRHIGNVVIADVTPGTPAEGRLEKGDLILRIDGKPVTSPDAVVAAVVGAPRNRPVTFVVDRHGQRRVVSVTPRVVQGRPQVGIQIGMRYRFPFRVSVDIDPTIGGPSAGLMFSLGIYDTLTPGSLTGGRTIAGTGTMDDSGQVGPIGGIQQKIVAAREAGAGLFLVPPANCSDAVGAPAGDMRLVKAPTMRSALDSIRTWVKDPEAPLPSCQGGTS